MPLDTNLQALTTRVATEAKAIRTLLNNNQVDLSALTTTQKANLVAAVNSLKAQVDAIEGGGSAVIDDGVTDTDTTWSSSKITTSLNNAINSIVNGAPAALDTLSEIATLLQANDNEIDTLVTGLNNRVRHDTNAQGLNGTQQQNARTNIGAGTSSLAIGTTAGTAKEGNWNPTADNITDATPTGRNVLRAASASAARTSIGAGTSDLVIGTTGTTAKAGNWNPAASNISDSTAVGRSVITAADATAARSAIGAASAAAVGDTEVDLVALFEAGLT